MAANFRGLLDDLKAAGELVEISKPVDIRHIAALVDQSDKGLLFTNVNGYDMPVVSGVINSRERLSISMGCEFGEIEGRVWVPCQVVSGTGAGYFRSSIR